MEETRYGLRVTVPVAFTRALERTTAALKAQGFGVITSIDMAQTLKEKLGRARAPYVILGACNPVLADRALAAEPEIGLLLPCNVIVYATTDAMTTVAAMAPLPAMGMIGNEALTALAREADTKLRAALAAIESGA